MRGVPTTAIEPEDKTPAGEGALAARLWALGSAAPLSDYGPPWDSIGAGLWGRLLAALAAPGASAAAAPASRLGYAECMSALHRDAPAVHRALMDIRGLALAIPQVKAPAVVPKRKPPGLLLAYEDAPTY
jgi:hypothetical protein